jgi:ABC-2 type transport system ATP-binding protein
MTVSITSIDLSKTYGKTQALDRLNLRIESGSIYGLIGPNGAGKTTSLGILAGLIKPTSGTAWILGRQVRPGCRRLAPRVGFSSPQFPLFDYLTGFEMMVTCGLMQGLPSQEVKKRTEDLMELLELQSVAGQYISHYSQGMRQKVGLACALIHAPEVLLLDEPFFGLDPASVYRLIHIFRQMADKRQTILVSSHNMELMERLCNQVGILHKGVLQREIAIVAKNPRMAARQINPDSHSMLETALWEVVGTPEPKKLNWI